MAEVAAAGVGQLKEEALQQKKRLRALQGKAGPKDKEEEEPKTKRLRVEEEENPGELGLQSYVPEDEDLESRRVPPIEPIMEEVNPANLAPWKPDWYLKQLTRCIWRTLAELICERLRGQEPWTV
ncbi:coiled-coil domain-containing protein 12-like [Ochotona curzoniae]|uniref:coiled-coil domain-containing protein 12-like n=1 Tax=Ochotona curzoniae TaxID=130825 RepID=UPI001B34B1BC|nr:coiled-coil domain-containing protein 12-like [Ochotona curzoniae]